MSSLRKPFNEYTRTLLTNVIERAAHLAICEARIFAAMIPGKKSQNVKVYDYFPSHVGIFSGMVKQSRSISCVLIIPFFQ